MKPPIEKIRVVFRRDRDATIIALFPDLPANHDPSRVVTYAKGEFGSADYAFIVAHTTPAKPKEYGPVYADLSTQGFDLMLSFRDRKGPEIRATKLQGRSGGQGVEINENQQQVFRPIPPPLPSVTLPIEVIATPIYNLQWLCPECNSTCVANDVMMPETAECPKCGKRFIVSPDYPHVRDIETT